MNSPGQLFIYIERALLELRISTHFELLLKLNALARQLYWRVVFSQHQCLLTQLDAAYYRDCLAMYQELVLRIADRFLLRRAASFPVNISTCEITMKYFRPTLNTK